MAYSNNSTYNTADWALRGKGAAGLMRGLGLIGNIGSSIGMYISKPGRDLAEIAKQTGLALGVKRVNAPVYTNEQLLSMGGSKEFMARPEMQKYQASLGKSKRAYQKLEKEVAKPTFITAEEQGTTKLGEITKGKGSGGKSNLYDYSTAVKDAAIVASMTPVTGGAGFLGAVGRGTVQGALGGLGATQGSLGTLEGQSEAFSKMAKGGAIGGVTSGVIYGVGKGIEKLKGMSVEKSTKPFSEYKKEIANMSKLEKQGIVDQAKASYLYKPGETTNETVGRFLKMRELTGMKSGTGQQIIDKMGETIDNFGTTKDLGLEKMSLSGSSDDIIGGASQKLGKLPETNKLLNSDTYLNVSDDVSKHFLEGAKSLDDYAIQLRNRVGYKPTMIGGQATVAPITPDEQAIYDAFADSIVDYLKIVSNKGDGFYTVGKEGLNNALRTIGGREVAKGMATRGGIGAYGVFAPENIIPTKAIGEFAGRVVGAGKEIAGSVPTFLGRAKDALPKVTSSGAPFGFASGVSTQGISGILGGLGSQIPTEGASEPTEQVNEMGPGDSMFSIDPTTGYLRMAGGDTGVSGGLGGGVSGSTMTVQDALAQAVQLFPNASETELISMAKMLMESSATTSGPGKLNMTQSKYYGVSEAAKSASALLDEMVSTSGQTLPGFGKTITSGLADLFNVSDPMMLAYRNKISSIDLAISNLLAGTNISKSESRRLKKLVPTMNDTPQEAQSKLAELNALGLTGMGSSAGVDQQQLSDQYMDY
jgi:hypothetical protein